MAKKVKKQRSHETIAPGSIESRMQMLYQLGDFFDTRKVARQILSDDDSSAREQGQAKDYLKRTSIDPFAVLAGVLSFIFTGVVALVAHY